MRNSHRHQSLLSALLKDEGWRERVVEEFVFGAAEHVRVTATFQFALDRELLKEYLPGAPQDEVRLLLPVTTRDKRSLLNFDLKGPDGQDCFLLPRDEIGVLQAGYLLDRLADAGVNTALDAKLGELLEAICTFTPALFRRFLSGDAAGNMDWAVAEYLEQGLPTSLAVTPAHVRRWRDSTTHARDLLVSALDEPTNSLSSARRFCLRCQACSTRLPTANRYRYLWIAIARSSTSSTVSVPPKPFEPLPRAGVAGS